MDLGSIFMIAALTLAVGIYISQPLLKTKDEKLVTEQKAVGDAERLRSSLMAERDRVLAALQELDFDNALGKIPAEDYPDQRSLLMAQGADVLHKLDEIEPAPLKPSRSIEDRIEAAIAARRADSAVIPADIPTPDEIELAIAAHRRDRLEKSIGFCPKCGNPIQKSDVFCSRCGHPVTQ